MDIFIVLSSMLLIFLLHLSFKIFLWWFFLCFVSLPELSVYFISLSNFFFLFFKSDLKCLLKYFYHGCLTIFVRQLWTNISVLASVDCLFSFSWKSSWYLDDELFVIETWILSIILWPYILLKSSVLIGFIWHFLLHWGK